ncbi:MAG: hypothetical protein LBU70_09735 [Chitinispirillales bacterium]|jgi:hypothetical protein|nr:hypothetical protein [Chitinispirillales bacterium]
MAKNSMSATAFWFAAICVATIIYADDGSGDIGTGVSEFGDFGVSIYGDMAAEVLVSPRSTALAMSDLAVNAFGPIASNPALAASIGKPELMLSYSSYYGNVFSASQAAYIMPIGPNGGVGVTAAYLLIPGIEDTRNVDIGALDDGDIEIFTASDIWTRVFYGHRLETEHVNLYAGAAVTARIRRLGEPSAYGLGADLGVMAHLKNPSIHAALLWENVRYSIVRWQSSDYTERIPQHLRLSLAFEKDDPYIYGRIALFYTSPDLLFNEGINYWSDVLDREEKRSPEVRDLSDGVGVLFSAGRFGIEYTIMETLSLRAGITGGSYSLGAGLELFNRRAGVDFAYLNHELAGTVKMSVVYRWM